MSRCDECVLLGAAGQGLDPDELQRRVQSCGDCPHIPGDEARVMIGRLTDALARANRTVRKTTSKLHQREQEAAELESAIVSHQDRLVQLENIQIAGVRAADRELEARVRQIEAQHREIAALSSPCIQIWDGVLVVPLIGGFDDVRAEVLRETVLAAVPRHAARDVILDLTGVHEIDRATVGHLFKIAAAIRLLGAGLILVGLGPRVALTIVQLGVATPDLKILRDLREAVAAVVRRA